MLTFSTLTSNGTAGELSSEEQLWCDDSPSDTCRNETISRHPGDDTIYRHELQTRNILRHPGNDTIYRHSYNTTTCITELHHLSTWHKPLPLETGSVK